MKTFLIRLFLFIPLVIIFWIAGVCIMGFTFPSLLRKNLQYTPVRGYSSVRLQEADTVKNAEILILGSSHAYRGFDTRIFKHYDLNIFNLGTSSQTPMQSDYLVDKYIDKIKPKYVIYEVYYNSFQKDGLESALDLIYSTPKPDASMLKMLFEVDKVKSYNSFIYAWFRKTVLGKKNPQSKKSESAKDMYIPGGYVASKVSFEDAPGEKDNNEVSFLASNRSAFENTLRKLKEKGIKVILVQAPTHKHRYQAITNPQYINEYFSSFKGLPYYNYNDIHPLSDDNFLDGSHLNQKGVNTFNKLFIEKLIAEGVLPNKVQSN